MALFPLYVDLTGRKCVIVGGGNIAARKIEALLEFEPQIVVISPVINHRIQLLKSQNKLKYREKEYSQEDIEDAAIIIAATSNEEVNEKIYKDAIKRNIPVNVVDDPEKCTFIFPSIVKRGELVIGVSTSGKYPALSKSLREKLETMFPEEYCDILRVLSEFRIKIRHRIQNPNERKKILNRVIKDFYSLDGGHSVERLKQLLLENDLYNGIVRNVNEEND